MRAAGFDIPADALAAATADGYDPEQLGREIADEIIRARDRETLWLGVKIVGGSLAIGLTLAALLWMVL